MARRSTSREGRRTLIGAAVAALLAGGLTAVGSVSPAIASTEEFTSSGTCTVPVGATITKEQLVEPLLPAAGDQRRLMSATTGAWSERPDSIHSDSSPTVAEVVAFASLVEAKMKSQW